MVKLSLLIGAAVLDGSEPAPDFVFHSDEKAREKYTSYRLY